MSSPCFLTLEDIINNHKDILPPLSEEEEEEDDAKEEKVGDEEEEKEKNKKNIGRNFTVEYLRINDAKRITRNRNYARNTLQKQKQKIKDLEEKIKQLKDYDKVLDIILEAKIKNIREKL